MADRAVQFIRLLKHTKGEWAGRPFNLLPWEEKIIRDLFGTVNEDGTRQYRKAYISVARKNGKALGLDTPIPTRIGWKTMAEVQPGDELFNAEGDICIVRFVSEIMHNHQCYEVGFSDGTKIIADTGHLWETSIKKSHGREIGIFTTSQIKDSLYVKNSKIERNHRIGLNPKLTLPDISLPVPPYTLGAWLGDGKGSTAYLYFTPKDSQILEEIGSEGISCTNVRKDKTINFALLGSRKDAFVCSRGHDKAEWFNHKSGKCRACENLVRRERRHGRVIPVRIYSSLQQSLRQINVLGNKHIPNLYLRSSFSQRLSLLQGLMDTDGYCSRAGQCEYTTVNKKLADDVIELIRTLGLKATVYTKRATIYGKDCGEKYRIQFWAHKDLPVFRLKRKLERLKPSPKIYTRNNTRYVISVTPVPSVPVKCIQVDGHLYLAGPGFVPTHNTELAGAIANYLLYADGEQGAEVYAAAADRDQASIVYGASKHMVEQAPSLMKVSKIVDSTKRIVYHNKNSFYRAISSEAYTKHGYNPSAVIADEVHVWPNRELWDVLETGMGTRAQPLMIAITTSGWDRLSLCYELYTMAKRAKNKPEDYPTFYPAIYELDEGDDWKDEQNWYKSNPGLGIYRDIKEMREMFQKACEVPAFEATFRRLYLNQWTSSETRWIKMEDWDSCAEPLRENTFNNRGCYGGLDLSSTVDITAFVLFFEPDENGISDLVPYFWVPGENIEEKSRRDRAPYDEWQRRGFIEPTEGNVVDYELIRAKVNELGKKYKIREIAYDPWNATQIAIQLEQDGFKMVPVRQGYASISAPTKELHKVIIQKRVRHGGNPVLRFMADSLMVVQDAAGNIKPAKDKSTARIDGIVAAIMALDRYARNESGPSVYETRGFLTLVEMPSEAVDIPSTSEQIQETFAETAKRCQRCGVILDLASSCPSCGMIHAHTQL